MQNPGDSHRMKSDPAPTGRVRNRRLSRRWLLPAAMLAIVVLTFFFGIQPRREASAALAKETSNRNVMTVSVIDAKTGGAARDLVLPGNVQAFTDTAVRRPDLVELRNRVIVTAREDREGAGTEVRITTTSGTEFRTFVNLETPAQDLDLQLTRLESKFDSLVRPVIGVSKGNSLRERVARLETEHSMAGLVALAVVTRQGAAV